MVIPGHEFVGRVVELDDEAASRWGIAVGDRVTSEQIVPCWECRFCKRGQYHMCQPHDLYGFKRRTPGAMATYMTYPVEALVHKISGDLPPAHAAFVEPLSCSLHAVERAQITFEDTVVVAGCGPIGLGMMAWGTPKWDKMGPWNMGRGVFMLFAFLSIVSMILIFVIGIQPPNDWALYITVGFIVLALLVWFALERRCSCTTWQRSVPSR